MTGRPMETAQDVVIACCRDEADLIGPFIDFYFDQGFDRICLVDNGSQDDTVEQILRHPQQKRILLLHDPRRGYDKRLLDYYRAFAPFAKRWIFFVDVDELIVVPGGIRRYAAQLPQAVNVLRLPTAEMRPAILDGVLDPLLSDRRESAFQREEKVVWKKGGVRAILCGKHDVDIEPRVEYRDERLFVRHFHTRSRTQLRSKLRNRIEADAAINEKEAHRLSSFSAGDRKRWLDHSRRLLQADGWEMERRRLDQLDWVEDQVIRDWWESRRRTRPLQTSPAIPLGDGSPWRAFCVREHRAVEGHTSPDHLVLIYSRPPADDVDRTLAGRTEVPVRIHSECLFGDAFGFDRCDCGQQLQAALRWIEREHQGVVIYLRQEGRGVGLFDKIRSLDVENHDSFARNEALGLPADARGYQLAARILHRLGVRSVRLLSGNPAKLAALEEAGIASNIAHWPWPLKLSQEAQAEQRSKQMRGYLYSCAQTPSQQGRHLAEEEDAGAR